MVLGRRGSDFDLAAMSLRDCSSSKCVANYFCSANPRSNRCAVPLTVTGSLDQRESLRTTSHAQDGSGLWLGVFDIAGASAGAQEQCRFLDNNLHFLDSHLLICALG